MWLSHLFHMHTVVPQYLRASFIHTHLQGNLREVYSNNTTHLWF